MAVEEKPNSFAKAIARLFSVQVIGLGCGFLAHLLLARTLAPEQYGVFNFVFSAAMLCALLGNFGFQASSVRLVPQFILEKQASLLRKFYHFSFVWILAIGGLIAFGIFDILSKINLASEYTENALKTGMGLALLIALVKLNSGILKGFKKGSWALAYESGLKEILLLCLLGSALFIGIPIADAQTVLMIVACIFLGLLLASSAHILSLIYNLKSLLSRIQENLSPPDPKGEKEQHSYRYWLAISLPMMLVISSQIIIHRSDIVILGLLASASDVGVYSAGAKLAQAATIGMMVLNIIFSPRASEAFYKGDTANLKHLYFKTLKLQTVSTMGLAVLIALGAHIVLGFLGSGYMDALPVIYILLGGYALNAIWGPVPFLMIMTKYERQAMWMTFAAALLNIVLNIVLIPIYGIMGAALSTVIALNLRNAGALFYILSQGLFSAPEVQQNG